MRMTDENGDTALHKAMRSRHGDVVKLLVKEDSEFKFPFNKAQETPLYLAAESGLREALIEILNSCKQPTSSAGPFNRTPLHAAVIQEPTDCTRLLMQWNKSLCEEPDVGGWNSLHFASLLGVKEVVSNMLGRKKALAYLPAGSENDWTTAIHISASAGKIDVLHELLNRCPDCWEMLDSNGRNALHEAILYSQANVVDYLLKSRKWDKLVEDPDNDGNTPLQLLASSNIWGYVTLELKDHPRAEKMSYNKDRIAPSLYSDFFISFAQLGRRVLKLNQLDRQKIISNQAKERDINIKGILSAAQMQLVVATLLVRVTFAAGFTLPGGFESDDNSPNKGMASLIRKNSISCICYNRCRRLCMPRW
ncbi:hypothetical protein P3S67_031533 [Capsicum chacoense]